MNAATEILDRERAMENIWDKVTLWVTMHITIPIGALFLAYHDLKEEIQ